MDTVFYQPAASPHQAKYRGGVGWGDPPCLVGHVRSRELTTASGTDLTMPEFRCVDSCGHTRLLHAFPRQWMSEGRVE